MFIDGILQQRKCFINQKDLSPNLPYWGVNQHLITRKQSCSEKAIYLHFFWNSWYLSILFISANAALPLFNSVPQPHNIYRAYWWHVNASFFPSLLLLVNFSFSGFRKKSGLSHQETNAFSKFYYVYKYIIKFKIVVVTQVQLMFFILGLAVLFLFISPTNTDPIRTAVLSSSLEL